MAPTNGPPIPMPPKPKTPRKPPKPKNEEAVLTLTEQKLLAGVIALMKSPPDVDYNKLSPMVGQKYPRNTRVNVRKLFQKLKDGYPLPEEGKFPLATATGGLIMPDDSEDEGNSNEEEEAGNSPKSKLTPTKVVKRKTYIPPKRSGVTKRNLIRHFKSLLPEEPERKMEAPFRPAKEESPELSFSSNKD